jgi:dipeptidyl aminopeptidase/acylaminoacyl peptidase
LSSSGLVVYQVNLFVVDANGGSPRKLSGKFELNAGEPVWSKDGKTIFFSADDHEANKIFSTDVAAGTVRPLTDAATVINLAEISANDQTAVGTWGDATHPDDVFRSDLSFSSLEHITNQNAWLADYALGASEVVRWKSSKDGLEIDGIVTKPVDFDGTHKVPFLLNPHGGPTGASLLSFSATEQIRAAEKNLSLRIRTIGESAISRTT